MTHMVATWSPCERVPQSNSVEVAFVNKDKLMGFVVLTNEHHVGHVIVFILFDG